MVYGIDILKVTALNLKMNATMSYPREPMLQIDFVIHWTHAVLKAVFYISFSFPSFDICKVVVVTSIWTQPFELSA